MQKKLSFIAGFALGALAFGGIGAFAASVIATPAASKVFADGAEVQVEAYNIDGSNYFKLRDIAKIADIAVDYDGGSNTVTIDTTRPYSDEVQSKPTPTAPTVVIYSDDSLPVPGETPGKILIDPDNPNRQGWDKYTEPYQCGLVGECAWYAVSRFTEVNGIGINTRIMGFIKEWIDSAAKYDDVSVITDIDGIVKHSIAVYIPKNGKTGTGHVIFVEYIERNSNGTPANVYFTEANGRYDLTKGKFDPGYDGIVQVTSFEDFKTRSGVLTGYIAPKN
jgi:surface antigen